MSSWFLYEFTVCLMGSISANIEDNLLNIDYAMSIMVLGSNNHYRLMNAMVRLSVSLCTPPVGPINNVFCVKKKVFVG